MIDPSLTLIIVISLPLAFVGLLIMRWSFVRKTHYNKFVSRRASVFNSITDAELRQAQDAG